MLNIEVIKFEAQDVITASVAAPCTHADKTWTMVITEETAKTGIFPAKCNGCGAEGTYNNNDGTYNFG